MTEVIILYWLQKTDRCPYMIVDISMIWRFAYVCLTFTHIHGDPGYWTG